MPKVSIIIPIYNVERYLEQCLNSVINQTLKDIEIILVDDGSSDNCPSICDAYANKDNRIKVIHQKNSGLGNAYNTGIKESLSPYIGFVEPDDWAELNMFEDLYNMAIECDADVAKSAWYAYKEKEKVENIKCNNIDRFPHNQTINAEQYPELVLIQPTVWSAIYKKTFLNEYEIEFLETPGASYQDTSFAVKTTAAAKRFVLTENAYIHYRRDNEHSSVYAKDKVYSICDEYDEIDKFLNKHEKIKNFIEPYKWQKQYSGYLWNINRIGNEYKEAFAKNMQQTFLNLKSEKPDIYEQFLSGLDETNKIFLQTLMTDYNRFLDILNMYKKQNDTINKLKKINNELEYDNQKLKLDNECQNKKIKDLKIRNRKQKNKIVKLSVIKFNLFGIKISHRRQFIKPAKPYIPKAIKKLTPNEISIVISADNSYAHYTGVTIQSIINNSSKNKKYTIYILDGGISLSNKLKLKFMQTHNVKIRYININSYLCTCNQKLLYTYKHFTIATYFRFFIPIIFRDFTKVIYCDCDGIFIDDIAKLNDINMGTNLLGAVSDTYYNIILSRPEIRDYSYNILKLKDPTNYFQAGLLIMNIPELKRMNFTESCFKALKAIKTPRYVDQCILNSVCQGKVLYLDASWNLENPVIKDIVELKSKLPKDFCDNYMKAFENPRFIHFCGPIKPWNTPDVPHSEYFWEYARMTPFYRQINKINQASIPNKKTFYKNSLQKVFSVKNVSSGNNCHKVLTIMGVRMKFKRKQVKIR